jgi:hypothetical protein
MDKIICFIFGHKLVLRGWGLQNWNKNEKTYMCDRCDFCKEVK